MSVRTDSLSATCPDVLWGRVQTEVHFHVAGMWLYGSGEGFFVCIRDSRSLAEGSGLSNAEARRCISQPRLDIILYFLQFLFTFQYILYQFRISIFR